MRLVDGNGWNQGRVELHNGDGNWGSVCSSSELTSNETDIICGALGFPSRFSSNVSGSILYILHLSKQIWHSYIICVITGLVVIHALPKIELSIVHNKLLIYYFAHRYWNISFL